MADIEKLPSEVETEAFRKQSIAKIRDAKVGPKEELDFDAILPKAKDKPSVYQAKLKASKMYLQNLENKSLKELKGSAVSENEMKRIKNSMPKKAKGGEIVIGKGRDYIKDLL
jgi:hypothetical protein